jgi:hypothetical protein
MGVEIKLWMGVGKMKKKYTDEFLLNELKRWYEKYGEIPTYAKFEVDKDFPSATVYKKRFGTWNKALKSAGFEVKNKVNYTKDELKNEAIEFYKLHKRAPYYYELSFGRDVVHKFWGTWDNFIKDCDIPTNRDFVPLKTKEEGIKFLQDLHKKLNKIPTGYDVEREGIGRQFFSNKFGSFNNALIEAGIIDKLYTKEEKIKNSLELIKKLYKKNNNPPTVAEYEEARKNDDIRKYYDRKNLEKHLNKTFSNICLDIIGDAVKVYKTKEQLYEELLELKNKLGRTPLAKELTEYGLSSPTAYANKFGMWYNDMILSFGWELSSPELKFKSKEEMLDDYLRLYEELGRIPLLKDLDECEYTCSSTTYKKYFGSLEEIWNELNIDVKNIKLNETMGEGFVCIDKNGNICNSMHEMIISNILIDNGVVFEKEYLYKNLVKTKRRWRFDWYLIDKNVGIEYFGLYKKSNKKQGKISKYTKKANEKIDFCRKNNIKLIALFPDDTKFNYKGVKEKLKSIL